MFIKRDVKLNKIFRRFMSSFKDSDVLVASYVRTPIGKLGGSLSKLSAPKLASLAIQSSIEKSNIDKSFIEEAFLGNVVSAGIGQAPTRQAVIYAGLPLDCPSTTINKVCASGMKAVMLASQSISSGYRNVMIAGGMESMSNIPHYMQGMRLGVKDSLPLDGMVHDGLWDIYNDKHMGNCGDACASSYNITRKEQDDYAIMSYKRAQKAWQTGLYSSEVIPVSIDGQKPVTEDEEYLGLKIEKVPNLKPAFNKDGSVTAANASKVSDGANAMVIVSGKFAREQKMKPLFKIRGFADAATNPIEFTIAPSLAIPRALKHAGVNKSDIDFYEINEAFAVVALVNAKILDLDIDKINIYGGAIALGHPLGSSGSRIIGALYNALKQNGKNIGCAAICNGGGGASAIIIERLN